MTVKTLDIDITKPLDNVPADKADTRASWAEIKTKYETLAGQALRYRGAWASGTYLSGDVVTHDDSWWYASTDLTTEEPGVDAEWVVLAGDSGSGLSSVTTEWGRLDLSVAGGVATIGNDYIAQQSSLDGDELTNEFVSTPLMDPSSTSANVTCNLSFGSDAGGEHIVCVMPLTLTGTITLRSADYATGGLVDGQASITAPGGGYFTIERLAGSTKHYQTSLVPAPTFSGLATFNGGVSLPVLSGVSGTLTMAHSGHTLILDDDATIPVTDGFMARFIASGASRDIDAGGTALSLADGDSVVIWTDGTTVWRSATETLATMATS